MSGKRKWRPGINQAIEEGLIEAEPAAEWLRTHPPGARLPDELEPGIRAGPIRAGKRRDRLMDVVSPMAELRDAPKHPRYVRELMEEDMVKIPGYLALRRLTDDCGFPEAKARKILNIAWEFGQKAEPCPGGYVHVWYHGKMGERHVYSVVEHIGNSHPGKVATEKKPRYTQSRNETPSRDTGTAEPKRSKGTKTMPPKRTTRQAAAPEPEAPANGEVDFQKYATKDFSPTMADYVTWMDEVLPGWDKMDVDRILVLGVSLYSHFQKSDFNIEQREARRAERAQGGAAAEEPATPPARTRGGRAASKPAPAASGRSGARNGKAPAAKRAGRTRATAGTAAAGGDAPF